MKSFLVKIWNSAVITLIILILVINLFGGKVFILDFIGQYTLHILIIISLLALIGIFINKHLYIKILYTLVISTSLFSLLQYDYFPLTLDEAIEYKPDIYYQNVEYFIPYDSAIADIEAIDAPILAIVEMHDEIPEILAEAYSGTAIYNKAASLSCGIFAKEKAITAEVLDLTYPLCYAQFEDFSLYVVHPQPPFSEKFWSDQGKYFAEVKELTNQEKGNWIVVGDFNSGPVSPLFRQYFNDYITHKSITWEYNTVYPLSLDHALSNTELEVEMLRPSESDHNALLIDIPMGD